MKYLLTIIFICIFHTGCNWDMIIYGDNCTNETVKKCNKLEENLSY